MLTLQNISYTHPNRDLLFDNINIIVNKHEKIALIGNNGVGKSTLLKLISGDLQPSDGYVHLDDFCYFIPQVFGQYNHWTIAQALRVDHKLRAFYQILEGNITDENISILDDDWTIEDRCLEALRYWGLTILNLDQSLSSLSGGQKTKVFLAGLNIHKPKMILLDEPSNHLDTSGRKILYDFIRETSSTILLVSHDRKLLNMLDKVYELAKNGITIYGGNYDFFAQQRQIANATLNQDILSKEKELRKAKEKEKEAIDRQQKLNARGKKKQEKAGVARIMMNTLKNNAENSTSKLKDVHSEKVHGIHTNLQELRSSLPDIDKMKFGINDSNLHRGKILCTAVEINHQYKEEFLWNQNISFQLKSGDRIALKGDNGSGKTTLINLILGNFAPKKGKIQQAQIQSIYIDQDYSVINNNLTLYEQTQLFNTTGLLEHEVKIRLNRFLFDKETWDKSCSALSGGERMRLILCCLTISAEAPDIIVLDEPTNNLDMQNIEILITAINSYQGTLIVVSHDLSFLEQIHINQTMEL